MNVVVLIGRLTKNVETRSAGETPVANFTLAVDRSRSEGADFIKIVVFGKQAENCDRYLSKGSQVAVNGRIQTGSYTNKDGVTVYTTEVIADRVKFLDSKPKEEKHPEDEPPYSRFGRNSYGDIF